MMGQALLTVTPLFLAAVVSAGLALFVAQRRTAPGAAALALLLLATAHWAICNVAGLLSNTLEGQLFWANLTYVGVVTIPACWILFILQYGALQSRPGWLTLGLLSIEPILVLTMIWTNQAHGLFRVSAETLMVGPVATLQVVRGPIFWIHTAYSYLLIGGGSLLMLRYALTVARIYRTQALLVVTAACVPWITNVMFLTGNSPFPYIDLTPIGFAVTGLLLALAITRARLFDLLPVGRDYIIEHMPDGMIVLDEHERIVDANSAVRHVLGLSRRELIGKNAETTLAPWPVVVALLRQGGSRSVDVELTLHGQRRIYDVRSIELRIRPYSEAGRIIIWRDATARRLAEAALRTSERKLLFHTRHTPLGCIEWDLESRVVAWNQAAEQIFGYGTEEVIGRRINDLIVPEALKPYIEELREQIVSKTGGSRSTNTNRTRDGHEIICDWYNTPLLDDAGNVTGWIALVQDITEREEMATAVRQSEERYRTLVHNLPDVAVLLFDDELRFMLAEGQTLERIGFTPNSLKNRRLTEVLTPDQVAQVEPAYRAALRGEARSLEVERGGRRVLLRCIPMRNEHEVIVAGMAVLEDVTERREAEQQIWHANHSLQMRIEELMALNRISHIFATEASLTTVLNSIAREMNDLFASDNCFIAVLDEQQGLFSVVADVDLNAKAASFLGRRVPIIALGPIYEQLAGAQVVILERDQINLLRDTLAPDALDNRFAWMLAVPLMMRGTLRGVMALSVEQDEGLFSEGEVRLAQTVAGQIAGAIEHTLQYEAIRQAREAAEVASQAKSRFLASMSHELRTPLNGILGYTQVLRRDELLPERHHDAVRVIEQSSEHLLALINDLLDLARIEAGRLDLTEEDVDLCGFLDGVAGIARLWTQQHGLGFIFNGFQADEQCPVPGVVRVDPRRLRQVLLNLLGNAVKFTDHGEVRLSIDLLQVDADECSCTLRFTVADTGIGIAAEDLARIFAPFEQAGETGRRSVGSGLGLAISNELLRLMHSALKVASAPGEGSNFWFDLPLTVITYVEPSVPDVQAISTAPVPAPWSFLPPIPAARSAELQQAALIGDVRAIIRLAEVLEHDDPSYHELAHELKSLARGFRIDAITQLLRASDVEREAVQADPAPIPAPQMEG